MNPELKGVAEHMRELGLGSMQHALRLSLYDGGDNRWWGELSVLHAAHAAEVLIKARIAQEHPLLIFQQVPKPAPGRIDPLSFEELLESGMTLQYSELPQRLWAATGIRIAREDLYGKFGRLRNSIQHFASPKADPRERTLEFIFGVVDPFIGEQWGLYSIDYNDEFGDHYEHILGALIERDLRPRLSPDAARAWAEEFIPDSAPAGYAAWFQEELKSALAKENAAQ